MIEQIWTMYSTEIISIGVTAGTLLAARLLPPPYSYAVSWVFEKIGEVYRKQADAKSPFEKR